MVNESTGSKSLLGVRIGDLFGARSIKDRKRKTEIKLQVQPDNKEFWQIATGDYSNRRILHIYYYNDPVVADRSAYKVEQLMKIEIFFKETIERLIKTKSDPVLVLDLGGMAGMTWARLAHHFQKQKDIQKGKVAFIVSSLAFDPRYDLDVVERLTQEQKQFILKTSGNIHFLKGGVRELLHSVITLPTGLVVPLKSHIDLIHESASVSGHSKIPETELLRVAQLLSEQGTLFTNKEVAMIDSRESEEMADARREGIKTARDSLKRMGLINVTSAERGSCAGLQLWYDVFRKPGALPITVNDKIARRTLL